jgi:hypothetical protein
MSLQGVQARLAMLTGSTAEASYVRQILKQVKRGDEADEIHLP